MIIKGNYVLQKTFTNLNFRLVQQKNSKNDEKNLLGSKPKSDLLAWN